MHYVQLWLLKKGGIVYLKQENALLYVIINDSSLYAVCTL